MIYYGESSFQTQKFQQKFDSLKLARKISQAITSPAVHNKQSRLSPTHHKQVSIKNKFNFSSSILIDSTENPDYFSENESSIEPEELMEGEKLEADERKISSLGQDKKYFEVSLQKKCGCFNHPEIELAKINMDSIRLRDDMRNKSRRNSALFMAINKQRIKEIELRNHLQHHNHGHHHHDDEEENLQSFCVKIFNKSLIRSVKNRHMNNHDINKLIQEAEQNMMQMQKVIENQVLSKTLSYRIVFKNSRFGQYRKEKIQSDKNEEEESSSERELVKKPGDQCLNRSNGFKIKKQFKMNNYQFLMSSRPNTGKKEINKSSKESFGGISGQDSLRITCQKRMNTDEKQHTARSNTPSIDKQTKNSMVNSISI